MTTTNTEVPSDKIYCFSAIFTKNDDPDPPQLVRNQKESLKLIEKLVDGAKHSYDLEGRHTAILMVAVKFPTRDDAVIFGKTLSSSLKQLVSPFTSVNQTIYKNHRNTLNMTIVITDSLTKTNGVTKEIEKFLLEGSEHTTIPATQ